MKRVGTRKSSGPETPPFPRLLSKTENPGGTLGEGLTDPLSGLYTSPTFFN